MYYPNYLFELFRYLVLYGPSIEVAGMNLGFYGGMSIEDICAQITKQSALFWVRNIEECEQIINQKIYSYYILFIYIVGYRFIAICTYNLIVFTVAKLNSAMYRKIVEFDRSSLVSS